MCGASKVLGEPVSQQFDLPESHADLLRSPYIGVLTTVGADGLPQSTAVWYLLDDDGVLKTSTTTERQKYKNLVRHPKATLFVLDPANPYRTIEVRANVELIPDPDKALLSKVAAHYDTPAEPILRLGGDRVIIAFDPVRIVTTG